MQGVVPYLGPAWFPINGSSPTCQTHLTNFSSFTGIIFNKRMIFNTFLQEILGVFCLHTGNTWMGCDEAWRDSSRVKLKFYVGWNCQSPLYVPPPPEFYSHKQESDNLWAASASIQYQQDLLIFRKTK